MEKPLSNSSEKVIVSQAKLEEEIAELKAKLIALEEKLENNEYTPNNYDDETFEVLKSIFNNISRKNEEASNMLVESNKTLGDISELIFYAMHFDELVAIAYDQMIQHSEIINQNINDKTKLDDLLKENTRLLEELSNLQDAPFDQKDKISDITMLKLDKDEIIAKTRNKFLEPLRFNIHERCTSGQDQLNLWKLIDYTFKNIIDASKAKISEKIKLISTENTQLEKQINQLKVQHKERLEKSNDATATIPDQFKINTLTEGELEAYQHDHTLIAASGKKYMRELLIRLGTRNIEKSKETTHKKLSTIENLVKTVDELLAPLFSNKTTVAFNSEEMTEFQNQLDELGFNQMIKEEMGFDQFRPKETDQKFFNLDQTFKSENQPKMAK